MADTTQAVQFVLRQEDSRLSGEITTIPGDTGGATRFGVASRFHHDLVAKQYFDKNADGTPVIANDLALAIAEELYEEQYGAKIQLAEIVDQDVANRVLSFAINEGPPQAVKIVQKALNSLGYFLAEDGEVGKATLDAINTAQPEKLIDAVRTFQAQFYVNLVAERPALRPVLQGLLNRAKA